MSAETFAQLESALRAHVADEACEDCGYQLLSDWLIVTASVGPDLQMTRYGIHVSETPRHSIDGLLIRARKLLDEQEM